MKYPYIGEWKEPGLTVLFVANCEGFEMGNAKNYQRDWSEGEYTNITHEYLQNTYGEVQSPEHAEFIVELAKANDIEVCSSFRGGLFFNFYRRKDSGKLVLFFFREDKAKEEGEKQISIPLPPKVETLKNAGDNLVLGCEDSKCDEWPCVGDDVCYKNSENVKGVVLAIDDSVVWVKDKRGGYSILNIENISKPKTPEEGLRDDIVQLIDDADGLSSHVLALALMDKYNIKPQ